MTIRYSAFAAAAGAALAIVAGSASANITITPTFDTSIQDDATNGAAMKAAINAAITQIQGLITNNVTVTINFKNDTSISLGQSTTQYNRMTYVDYKAALVAKKTSADDNTAIASLPAALPALLSDNSDGNGMKLTRPLLRALGQAALGATDAGTNGGFDGNIALNMNKMNLSRTAGQVDGKYDLQTVIMHEICETLGAGGNGSFLENFPTAAIGPLDLFRWKSNGTRSFAKTSPDDIYFSIDGGATSLSAFNAADATNGDSSDWDRDINGYGQVQDAFGTPYSAADGVTGVFNIDATELTALDVVGWQVVPAPSSMALLGLGGLIVSRRRRA